MQHGRNLHPGFPSMDNFPQLDLNNNIDEMMHPISGKNMIPSIEFSLPLFKKW
jgi:hypothetical protein